MTVIAKIARDHLPAGTAPVEPWGLLSRVHRPCPDHAGDCACVGRDEGEGRLVFWCETGQHHITRRQTA
ncbi:MAG: hypothetical protein AB7V42_09935 [Thermoleophilia bacterium]